MGGFRAIGVTLVAAAMVVGRAGAQAAAPVGRIGGRVIDAATSKPLPSARVVVVGIAGAVETDLDGRFRTGPVAVGLRSVRIALIGYKPAQIDSVKVVDGQTAVVTVALGQAPVQLAEISVSSEAPAKTSNAAGLLAIQQAAPAVTDGISAEAIGKTPDKDAGAAMMRVTGLSVVENKVVVRGLAERYSTSLLNGVEIASPEPDKKFVPLDAFNANLLESIVASKTATPDKPGDFAGGTVDIQTKEFPENFVFRVGVSQGYNSRSTFKAFPRGPRTFGDRLGVDGQDRGIRANNDLEKFAENLNPVWTPGAVRADPNTNLDFSLGGRKDLGGDALGYVFSLTYANERTYNPDRLNGEGGGSPVLFQESFDRIDWSGIANFAYRIGADSKIGFKNFYSRGSEEVFRKGAGGDNGDGPSLNYQGRFLEKYIGQSQVTGDHYVKGLLKSRINWKLSYGQAGRADLDNRQLRYVDRNGTGFLVSTAFPSYRYNNSLRDQSYTGQLDWAFPFSLTHDQGGEFKLGASYRQKDRIFGAQGYELAFGPESQGLLALPPEQLLAPENLAADRLFYKSSGVLDPYGAKEEVQAAYGMVDMDLIPGLRLVGGLRAERWKARLTQGDNPRLYQTTDFLWSGNLTWIVNSRTNLRFAAYRTVARPDLRELASGGYADVVGGIGTIGNPALVPANVLNGDIRFEIYPGAGELIAVSGFIKHFDNPIVTTFITAGDVVAKPDNLDHATSIGAEFEVRKTLAFIAKRLRNLSVGGNLTLIRSRVRFPSTFTLVPDPNLRFQGQSPYLINASLTYGDEQGGFSASVLYNRFGDRILRYGVPASPESNVTPINTIELPRNTLDAKLKTNLWRGIALSLSGKNLLNQPIRYTFDRLAPTQQDFLLGRSQPGVSFTMGLTYVY